jgi:hypothetical protein
MENVEKYYLPPYAPNRGSGNFQILEKPIA